MNEWNICGDDGINYMIFQWHYITKMKPEYAPEKQKIQVLAPHSIREAITDFVWHSDFWNPPGKPYILPESNCFNDFPAQSMVENSLLI